MYSLIILSEVGFVAILQANFHSESLCRKTNFNAVIPISNIKPLRTLYLLHGIYGDYSDWLVNSRIAYWAEERNLAVIMPSGDNSFYVDNEKSSAMYGDFFGHEIVEATRELFHLSEKRYFYCGSADGRLWRILNRTKTLFHKNITSLNFAIFNTSQ
jgi:S-formylglutathione hydrolase FrmB